MSSMLASLLRQYATQDGEQEGGNIMSDRQAYNDYVMACQENGKKALTFAEWLAAGKPRG